MKEVDFTVRVYKISKGKNSQNAYFATVRKVEIDKLKIKEKEGVLLKVSNKIFPTVVRKLKTTKNKFMLGFTIPYKIGKKLLYKQDIKLKFLKKNIKSKYLSEIKGYINLQKIIPNKTIRNYPIYLFDLNDKLMIWIYSKGNKPYILPKYIPINKKNCNLFEFAGAFFCEGFKARKINRHRDRFSFSNADAEQIEWFTNVVENLLNISKDRWKADILYPSVKKDLIEFWESLGLSRNKIKITKNKTIKANKGVCILNIHNSTLAEVIYYLMEYLDKKALVAEEYALYFFRGLSRGDIGIFKKNALVSFTTESKKNALFFKALCNKLKITTSRIYHDKRSNKGSFNVFIYNYSNLKKLAELEAITHNKRKIRFYENFLNYKKSKYLRYLYTISLGYNTTIKSAEFLELSQITTRFYLAKLKKEGFLNRYREINKQFRYSLTKEGMKQLKFYKKVMKNANQTNFDHISGSCRFGKNKYTRFY